MDEKKKRENIDEEYLRTKFAHDLWDDEGKFKLFLVGGEGVFLVIIRSNKKLLGGNCFF